MIRALAALALAGCNPLLGIGEPTLLPTDASLAPSCATGWQYRVPLQVAGSMRTLRDHQISLVLDTATAIRDGKLQPTAADLRFTTERGEPIAHVVERDLDTGHTRIWIKAPDVPIGTSTLHLYYGNPLAEPRIEPTFETDIIANPSFEFPGGWTLEPAIGTPAQFNFQMNMWSTDGVGSLQIDAQVNGERASTSSSSISQPATFPAGSDYVIRFDINVVAASNGGINGTNNGSFLMTFGNGIFNLWVLSGDRGNITGTYLDEETYPFGPGTVPLSISARVAAGVGSGYAKGYLDHLRVRKHASPEPTIQVGDEQSICP